MSERFPDPYKRVSWRGGKCDMIDKVAFQVLEDRLNATATIFQLGYNAGGVAASSHTHDGGGAFDYWFPTIKDWATVVRASRRIGLDAWKRNPPMPLHIHAGRHGSVSAHPELKQQMGNYEAGGDGLWPLVAGDDPMPYRPDPLGKFTVAEYYDELRRRRREDRLRDKLRRIGRSIKHLQRRKRKTRRELKRVNH